MGVVMFHATNNSPSPAAKPGRKGTKMFVIEWIGGEIEKYHTRESWERRAAVLKARGFHENWDFYCFEHKGGA